MVQIVNFKINESFKKKFLSFISSNLFQKRKKIFKSNYWEYHTEIIKYTIRDNILSITGDSGFYYEEKNFIKKIKKKLKNFLNIFNFSQVRYTSYVKAFEKAISLKKNLKHQVQFNKSNLLANNIKEIKKIFPFTKFEINDHVIRSYYNINLLNSYFEIKDKEFILEIGPGGCNLVSLLKHHFSNKCFVLVDLPETLILSISTINELFPQSKILFPNECDNKINTQLLEKYDFIFLTPDKINLLEDNLIDLSINTNSFGEMQIDQVNKYLKLIQRVSKNGSFFFNTNRIEKYAIANKHENNNVETPPTRYIDYNFFNNDVKFYEICDFKIEVQRNPVFTRLEKVIK